LGDGAEQRPVVIVERWSGVQSVQDAELVTQDDDLKVFGAAGTYSEAGKRREEAVQNSIHTLRIGGDLPCSTATSEFRAPTGFGSSDVFGFCVVVDGVAGGAPDAVCSLCGIESSSLCGLA
jgi:hypothetical protein